MEALPNDTEVRVRVSVRDTAIFCGHDAFGNALDPDSLGFLVWHQWKMKGLLI